MGKTHETRQRKEARACKADTEGKKAGPAATMVMGLHGGFMEASWSVHGKRYAGLDRPPSFALPRGLPGPSVLLLPNAMPQPTRQRGVLHPDEPFSVDSSDAHLAWKPQQALPPRGRRIRFWRRGPRLRPAK